MPRFRLDARLSWSFSAQAGPARPHGPRRATTAAHLLRASALRSLIRAATRPHRPGTAVGRRGHVRRPRGG
ncbi:hypothetical protein ACIQAC_17565 [Streptomyces sp. NPDC088387]|uniref:hypothetical protein n=1 Tax=Streptomyces sp. NPDC088387 TaxID=3365859 RepID=UPI0037FD7FBB